MNGFGGESGGVPQTEKRAREHRMRDSAKKQVARADLALHKYRARAAAILHAEGMHADGREEPHSTYVFKILRHRETGVRVRVLDTLADDAPEREGKDIVHQYLVECQTHGQTGPSFASARAAMASARHPEEWCTHCASLAKAQPKARSRARTAAGGEGGRVRRRDDVWP
jgi:hypothetical protein